MIKNLLYVGKVIYLISSESDIQEKEQGEPEDGNSDEEEEKKEQEKEAEEEEDRDNRPPSLLWLMKKLSLMAKREAAHSPKVPLKVRRWSGQVVAPPIHCANPLSSCREPVSLNSWGRRPSIWGRSGLDLI